MDAAAVHARYPNLFQVVDNETAHRQFEAIASPPPEPLISNVNVVPFAEDKCIVLRLEDGSWELPGGTLEPGEDYRSALRRELLEEAGAELVSAFVPFGAWRTDSRADRPYRPHLPHPVSYRLVGYGDVRLVSVPAIPETGGERVEVVAAVTTAEAAEHFRSCGRSDLAELYLLAAALRAGQQGGTEGG
ncbi:hypothetical protein J31TS4_26870 [Paenibacillus sp. J31TS4]|uniref:NUDIX domain-containing protein n=1 Tax=Paenibacillus sp. J31TS4 TaxID=2807195 RepID=UPI001B07FDFC|nr:NUDIX domain-containing protein [Paenibacillus sp. J31TS4]GIP39407.1 hypothetical protein J31TS4_26870 [Paenibacillus sp. J31TS4]